MSEVSLSQNKGVVHVIKLIVLSKQLLLITVVWQTGKNLTSV